MLRDEEAAVAGVGTKLPPDMRATGAGRAPRNVVPGAAAPPGTQVLQGEACNIVMACSASAAVRPMSQSVRTKCPRILRAWIELRISKSMSSMATQWATSGCRSNHSQISISRGVFNSFVQSITGEMPLCCKTPLSIATFACSRRQVLDRTIEAPVLRITLSNAAQHDSTKRSSPKRE